MIFEDKYLFQFYNCKSKIVDSNFENFLAYKHLFKIVYDASNNLSIEEFKSFCANIGLTPYQAKCYYTVYDKLFNPEIIEYKISDELASRAKNWTKDMWIEFSKAYTDDLTCRKVLFNTLITKKLKYSNVSIPVELLNLNDIRKFRKYVDKFKPNKAKKVASSFKSLRTRLNNFINKDFRNYTKADNELMNRIREYHDTLVALIEEHMESSDEEVDGEVVENTIDTEMEPLEAVRAVPEPVKVDQELVTTDDFSDPWVEAVRKYIETDIYKLYSTGNKLKVNWANPYYAVIFLGLDIFNIPDRDEYRKKYKELIILFHPDTKRVEHKAVATTLLTILNDINLNIWGSCGERYLQFINSIKFSLIKLGV